MFVLEVITVMHRELSKSRLEFDTVPANIQHYHP
jgi:hypothetical protein